MFKKVTMISKKTIREFDKDGNVIREQIILNDGGMGQEAAEKKLSADEEKMDKASKRMDSMFKDMDDLMKDLFK